MVLETVDTPQLAFWYPSMAYCILFFSWISLFRFSSLISYSYMSLNASGLLLMQDNPLTVQMKAWGTGNLAPAS